MNQLTIRRATEKDFFQVYSLGLDTAEFSVDQANAFMMPGLFRQALTSERGVFLVVEVDGAVAGFAYANLCDPEVPAGSWACLVYLVVKPKYRRQGLGTALYQACEKEVQAQGASYLYAWAHVGEVGEPSPIFKFLKRQGHADGQDYRWMQKDLDRQVRSQWGAS